MATTMLKEITKGPGGKPLMGCMTAGVHAKYGPLEGRLWLVEAVKAFLKYPVDMIILEWKEKTGKLVFRAAGYEITADTDSYGRNIEGDLEEKKKIKTLKDVFEVDTMWLKVDDHGDKFVATLLFPSEY